MFQLSPGVNVTEVDLTNVVPAIGTSIGAFCGQFKWGPANQRILIDSENSLVSTFGKPDDTTFPSFFTAANFLAYTNNLRVVRAISSNTLNATANTVGVHIDNQNDYEINFSVGTQNNKYGAFYARYPGTLGNSLSVSVCSSASSFKTTGLKANTVTGNTMIKVTSDVSSFLNANDVITVGGVDYTVSTVANTNVIVSAAPTSNNTLSDTTTKWAYASYFDSAPGTSIYGSSQGASNDEMHIIVIDTDGKFSGEIGTVLERFSRVSKASDAKTDDGSPNYYVTKVLNESKYIYVSDALTGTSDWGTLASLNTFDAVKNYSVKLAGGTDTAPTTADIVSGYDLFSNGEEVDISLIMAGWVSDASLPTIANKICDVAYQRKDCVAFISPKRQDAVSSVSVDNIIAFRNVISPSTSYSVMDSGWKYQFDKYNNTYRYVPLNGDIAGLCARTDNVRDPWWSPAGLNRGQILNAIKLSWNPSKAQRDELYKNNINPVVSFPGEGIVLFGDKTMQAKASAFDRINVRRLFIVLEKSIATAAKYSLFEFNDEFTRSQFVALVEPYLRDVKGRRGIYDFRVVCDTTNNTPEVIDTNRFVGDIYIKPARSINFIQLNFVAVRTGVEFSEVAGKF